MAYKDKAAKTAYQNEYIKKAYDRVNLLLPSGYKEQIRQHSASMGESVNAYIRRLIDQDMNKNAPGA